MMKQGAWSKLICVETRIFTEESAAVRYVHKLNEMVGGYNAKKFERIVKAGRAAHTVWMVVVRRLHIT